MSAPTADAGRTKGTPGDRPSRHGALMGELLAKLAEAGATGDLSSALDFMCATCAFRRGTYPNTTASTGLMAFNCTIGADPDQFVCHHGMKDGHPQRLCAGYLAAKNAPFDVLKAETIKLHGALADIGDGDDVRAAFDAWANEIDPDYKLDVYEITRLWQKAARAEVTAISAVENNP